MLTVLYDIEVTARRVDQVSSSVIAFDEIVFLEVDTAMQVRLRAKILANISAEPRIHIAASPRQPSVICRHPHYLEEVTIRSDVQVERGDDKTKVGRVSMVDCQSVSWYLDCYRCRDICYDMLQCWREP